MNQRIRLYARCASNPFRLTLCAFHHQRCLHAGRLRIRGLAPDRLLFELGVRPDAPPLARYRSGDVLLADHESHSGGAAPAGFSAPWAQESSVQPL